MLAQYIRDELRAFKATMDNGRVLTVYPAEYVRKASYYLWQADGSYLSDEMKYWKPAVKIFSGPNSIILPDEEFIRFNPPKCIQK